MNVFSIPTKLNGIGLIRATLTKRYPVDEESWCRNEKSTLLVSVESGAVNLFLESVGLWNGTHYVEGQSFVIDSGQNYYLVPGDKTKVVLGVASAPAWRSEQHIIESIV